MVHQGTFEGTFSERWMSYTFPRMKNCFIFEISDRIRVAFPSALTLYHLTEREPLLCHQKRTKRCFSGMWTPCTCCGTWAPPTLRRTKPMEKPYQGPHSHLFTVRLWQEEVGSEQSEWRGKVQQVSTGEAYYFRGWEALISLLLQMLAASEPPPKSS